MPSSTKRNKPFFTNLPGGRMLTIPGKLQRKSNQLLAKPITRQARVIGSLKKALDALGIKHDPKAKSFKARVIRSKNNAPLR